jgi:hypothetical protein
MSTNMVKGSTETTRDVGYLKVPGAWFDTRLSRPKLVKAIVNHPSFGPGWQVERISLVQPDGTKMIRLVRDGHVDPTPGLGRELLIEDVSDTKAKVFDARFRRAGISLVFWEPTDRVCHFASLTPTARELRDRLALILKVKAWDLEIAPEWGINAGSGDAEVQRVVISRAPEVGQGEKRRETWCDALTALYPVERGATWVFTSDAMAGTVVMTRRPDPLRATLLAGDFDPDVQGVPVATIGRSEHSDGAGADLFLDLANMATHLAVQGQTRSGKSIFAYQMLTTLAASQSVLIAGADPSGILLAPFRGTRHAAWQATGTKRPEDVLDMLGKVLGAMDRRTEEIAAEMTDKIEVFTPQRPLIVVALEEFPGIRRAIETADVANGAGSGSRLLPLFDLAVSRLAAEGAKVGIRMVIMAQRLDTTVLKGGDRANIPTRISFRVDKSEAIGMLHESLPTGLDVEKVRNFPPGVGLYESAVAGQRVVRFRAPLLEGGYAEYVRRVRAGSPAIDVAASEIAPEIIELAELEFSLEDLETFTTDDEEPAFEGFEATTPDEPPVDSDLAALMGSFDF